MAKTKLTKDQINQNKLRDQYNAQVNRIRTGYFDIKNRGGLFSVTVDDIIGDRYNPDRYSKRDITRLKKISKENLYRMARTETGKSGYSILSQRRSEAGKSGARASKLTSGWKRLYSIESNIPVKNIRVSDASFQSWRKKIDDEYEQTRNAKIIDRVIHKETVDEKRERWQKEYLKEQQKKFEKGTEKNPRLDAVDNFIHLTPEEFKNLQVTGKVEYTGKGAFKHASITDVNLVDTSTGEIIESSDRGVTPVEVNGTIYQYDPETNRFIPSGHISREAKERWYKEEQKEEYSPSSDIEIDSQYDFTDEPPEERTYPADDSYDDEDYDVPDFYTDLEGNTYDEEETKDFIDTKLDNIYDRMDALDSYGDQLREELDSAMEEMDDADKARFLDEFGDDLEGSLEAEARYKNDKDGDVRDNERGFNHFHNQSLNIIWNGAVPLSHLNNF